MRFTDSGESTVRHRAVLIIWAEMVFHVIVCPNVSTAEKAFQRNLGACVRVVDTYVSLS